MAGPLLTSLGTALVVLVASGAVGQGVARLAGARDPGYAVAPIGFAVLLTLAPLLIALPGHAITAGLILLALAVAGGWWTRRALWASVREPARILVVAGVVLLLAVPFVVNGRTGMLGMSFNDDPRFHLWAVDFLRETGAVPTNVLFSGYPIGPHALAALLGRFLGVGAETGLDTMLAVGPLVAALAGAAALPRAGTLRRVLVGLAAGVPYLVAAYYAQGAFKETILAALVLAFVLQLRSLSAGPLRWRAGLPGGLMVAGGIAAYTYPALLWFATAAAVAVAADVVQRVDWRRAAAGRTQVRTALARAGTWAPTALAALGVLVLSLIPQAGTIAHSFTVLGDSPAATGAISTTNIGNLVAQLSVREVLGMWPIEDFRFQPHGALREAMTAIGLVAIAYGLVWWTRRRDLIVPACAVLVIAIFLLVSHRESPYVAAKALVVAAPLVSFTAAAAVTAVDLPRRALRAGMAALAAALLVGMGYSSYLALRSAQVAPPAHEDELRALRPLVQGSRVLYLANDNYAGWRLMGATVTSPPVTAPVPFTLRPEKTFHAGDPLDFDSVQPSSLDLYDYVITTSAAYGSAPPPNFELVRRTRSFELWRRTGPTPVHGVLDEGWHAGAVLRCHSRAGRRIARRGGTAVVGPKPVVAPGPAGGGVGAGHSQAVELRLRPGRWRLSAQYLSPQPVHVSAPGLRATMPANLDQLGQFWPAGTVRVSEPTRLRVRLRVDQASPLFAKTQFAVIPALAATKVGGRHDVPLRQACGDWVDSYVPAR